MLFDQCGLQIKDVVAVLDEKANAISTTDRGLPLLPLEAILHLPAEPPVLISSTTYMSHFQERMLGLGVSRNRLIEFYDSTDLPRMAALAADLNALFPKTPPARSAFEAEREYALAQLCGALDKMGYTDSLRTKRPMRTDGRPFPWFTYPAILYLDQLDLRDKRVFEWGCGYSSLYFATCCQTVRSIECHADWMDEVRRQQSPNMELLLRPADRFAEAIDEFPDSYDIILIDAERRLDCAARAVQHLSKNGLIIVDNSDNCPKTCAFLREKDLIQIDFYGFGPVCIVQWVTSFFLAPGCRLIPRDAQPLVPPSGLERDLDS